jgi:ABC-2 type transport system ATP-binding protein
MEETVIEVEQLRCRYGKFEAVKGISFEVRRGELFALLGANGAGKTTTIEMLEGMGRPASGKIRILGRDPIRDRAAVRARTGVMLQAGGFSGTLTVRETIDIWRDLTSEPRSTDEAMELVGLTHRADVSIESLSGGEERRLDLAVAALGHPELLFLDEPTSGMDPASRRKTWEVVRDLQRGGTTVLLTTHYLEEAEVLADRLAIMKAGQIVMTGTPEEVATVLPARITFRVPPNSPPLPELTHATREIVETGLVLYESTSLQADLSALLAWANEHALTLPNLSARPASLEDVFMDVAVGDGAAADKSNEGALA